MTNSAEYQSWTFNLSFRPATAALTIAIVFSLAAVVPEVAQAQTFTVLHDFTGGGGRGHAICRADHGPRWKPLWHGFLWRSAELSHSLAGRAAVRFSSSPRKAQAGSSLRSMILPEAVTAPILRAKLCLAQTALCMARRISLVDILAPSLISSPHPHRAGPRSVAGTRLYFTGSVGKATAVIPTAAWSSTKQAIFTARRSAEGRKVGRSAAMAQAAHAESSMN